MQPQARESEWEALETLKQMILEGRARRGLSQTQLADELGCSPSFIAKLETLSPKGPLPSQSTAEKLEQAFKLKKGQLWALVQAAKTEINQLRLERRAETNSRQREKLGLRATSGHLSASTLGLGVTSTTAQIDLDAQVEIGKIMPDLMVAMTNATNRAVIAGLLKGLADQVRESSQRLQAPQDEPIHQT